ncbi:YycC family protein [Bacillus subtilis]
MRPLQISAESAQKLAASLNLPLEQMMHMPQHILLAKLVELQKEEQQS